MSSSPAKGAATRAAAAYSLQQVLQHQRSLNQALPEAVSKFKLSPEDKGFTQAIAFGVLRELPTLEWLLSQLLDKPLKSKVRIVHYLLLTGIYQLRAMRTAEHAAVSATVDATPLLRQKAFKGLVNGVLRSFQRQQQALEAQLNSTPGKSHNHPGWLVKRLQHAYPDDWQAIIEANQVQPPMWLRLNQRYLTEQQLSSEQYQTLLADNGIQAQRIEPLPDALKLVEPCDVTRLPGFTDGAVSVQDGAAQFAVQLLPIQHGQRVLDACAAPGGKTAHLLEHFDIKLDALDIDEQRMQRVAENLSRLQLQARTLVGDASEQGWWDGERYDHILLDAPCSATGVIRRHPDIKWLRLDADIDALVHLQRAILDNLWQLLQPGGTLVYATCSVLPDENQAQIAAFLATHNDAQLIPFAPITDEQALQVRHLNARQQQVGAGSAVGLQWLPQMNGHDGFYYARLEKAQA